MEATETTPVDEGRQGPPDTMKVWIQERYGTSDVFELVEMPVPGVDENRVLVEVHASSVNALDWHLSTGYPFFVRLQMGVRRPKRKTPGADVAGVVVDAGPDVTRFKLGDRVVGETTGGGFGEYVMSGEDALVTLPDDVDFSTAAAIPVAGLTAIQALRTHADLQPGQRVLINGGSGGVGTFAVQIAKIMGAEVTAVCSTGNVEQARLLGADQVVDYKKQAFSDVGGGFDVIVDLASSQPIKVMKSLLTPSGTYLYIGGPKRNMPTWLARYVSAKWKFRRGDQKQYDFTAEMNEKDLSDLVSWSTDGRLSPAIESTYPLDRAMEALDHLSAGHSKGKSVIVVR